MSKTLIGMVTFGNLEFTQLAVREIRRTTAAAVDLALVVGKPGDQATAAWCRQEGLVHWCHGVNMGFPASINDLYDHAWRGPGGYDYLVICGNDVVPYPGAIDALIEEADRGEFAWVASSQFDVASLCSAYPEQRRWFEGSSYLFRDFDQRPWDAHAARVPRAREVVPHVIADVHNLCLYHRSVADAIGYIDVNFFPAYFSDNDYCVRGHRAGVKACQLRHSAYFHFWSRTIHQGSGGSTHRYFDLNQEYYRAKWGGLVNDEHYALPFGGRPWALGNGVTLPGALKINDRSDEYRIVEYWRERGR